MESLLCCVPPGFRFHPTEEELVGYYLARKVASHKQIDIIQEVDLYRMEPWDLVRVLGGGDHEHEQRQQEWYFFSYKDRKYPSGTRTNRATAAGFWKATGRDKPVISAKQQPGAMGMGHVIGMRKTLVFYKGRAPHGRKTEWIMHEYRLQSNHCCQEEGWVVCRAFRKPVPNPQNNHYYYLSASSSSPLPYYPPPPPAAAAAAGRGIQSNMTKQQQHLLDDDDDDQQQQQHLLDDDDDDQQQQQLGTMIQQGGDWNFLDTLLYSTIHDS